MKNISIQNSKKNLNDLLKFWYENSKEFPILFNIAKKVLSIPATEFDSERNFSLTGRICENRRTNLDENNIDHLVLIKNHFKL